MQSKTKIATAFAVALIVISISYAMSEKSKPTPKTTQEEVHELVQAALQKSLKNPDAAALQAWEDSIYKNHPEMDQLLNGTSTEARLSTTTQPTATDLFSRDIFSKYMEAKQAGKEIDAQVQKEIVDAVLGKTYVIEEPEYDGKDLVVIQNPKTPEYIRYGNTITTLIETPAPDGVQHELFIFEKLSQQPLGDKDFSDALILKARYEKMRSALKKIAVPSDIVTAHTNLVRGFDGIIAAIDAIPNIDKDPIGVMSKITRYDDAVSSLNAWSMAVKAVFIEKGVVFSANEPGASLLK